ncbi:hypothetical protein AOQ84DRAFT_33317 [Glonium stellatum]|uniref:Uncharacterized protein n=1 Tax=Glonium stellatum TaxID=574774 RepID=A0A8E2FC21_9PEZI|nr:hypothetical protein AOQ84DRAFT_33317 [Glonium stellatum]
MVACRAASFWGLLGGFVSLMQLITTTPGIRDRSGNKLFLCFLLHHYHFFDGHKVSRKTRQYVILHH